MFVINGEVVNLPDEVCRACYDAFSMHIDKVQKFGRSLDVPESRLAIHDQSKFSKEEFYGYARHHYGDRGDEGAYAKAWLHHINFNDHHWQHWIFPDGYTIEHESMEGCVVRMPYVAILEMIADWKAASYIYSKTTDMWPWLTKNAPRILLHSQSAKIVCDTLYTIGYKNARELRFKSERSNT